MHNNCTIAISNNVILKHMCRRLMAAFYAANESLKYFERVYNYFEYLMCKSGFVFVDGEVISSYDKDIALDSPYECFVVAMKKYRQGKKAEKIWGFLALMNKHYEYTS